MIGIIGFGAWRFDSRPALVSGGIEHLFLPQELCDLHRSPSLHAQLEDSLDYHNRRFVHDPICFVCRVFEIPNGTLVVSGTPRSPFAFCTARILRLVSLAKNSLNQFLIPAISLSVLLGSMVSKWSLMAIYQTLYFGK